MISICRWIQKNNPFLQRREISTSFSRIVLCFLLAFIPMLSSLSAQEDPIRLAWEGSLPAQEKLIGLWKSNTRGELLVFELGHENQLFFHKYQFTRISMIPEHLPVAITEDYIDEFEWIDDHSLFFDGHKYEKIDGQIKAWPPSPATPLQTYYVFCELLKQHYPFAALRGVNLEAVFQQYEKEARQLSSADDLFPLFSKILSLFKDNHMALAKGFEDEDEVYFGVELSDLVQELHKKEASDMLMLDYIDVLREAGLRLIQESYVHPFYTGTKNLDELFIAGVMKDRPEIGYLNISSLDDCEGDELDDYLDAFLSFLNEQNVQNVVIDLRYNLGGYDSFGKQIADRFAKARHLAYTVSTYYDYGKVTAPVPTYVEPSQRVNFEDPTLSITVLTSPLTASAGESLAMMLSALPQTLIIGQPTMGVLSDQFARRLPNGWWLILSNEIRHSPHGEIYEKIGVPVDIEGHFTSLQDILRGEDPLLEQVFQGGCP